MGNCCSNNQKQVAEPLRIQKVKQEDQKKQMPVLSTREKDDNQDDQTNKKVDPLQIQKEVPDDKPEQKPQQMPTLITREKAEQAEQTNKNCSSNQKDQVVAPQQIQNVGSDDKPEQEIQQMPKLSTREKADIQADQTDKNYSTNKVDQVVAPLHIQNVGSDDKPEQEIQQIPKLSIREKDDNQADQTDTNCCLNQKDQAAAPQHIQKEVPEDKPEQEPQQIQQSTREKDNTQTDKNCYSNEKNQQDTSLHIQKEEPEDKSEQELKQIPISSIKIDDNNLNNDQQNKTEVKNQDNSNQPYQNQQIENQIKLKQCPLTNTIIDQIISTNNTIYEQFQNQFSQLTCKIIDQSFPSNWKSICAENEQFKNENKCEWKRISDIQKDKFSLFAQQIQSSDVLQGELGDCYFLSSLSALAQRQFLIKRLFLTQNENNFGCYYVMLCQDGTWNSFLIDDYVPLKFNQPWFCSINGTSGVWPLLLEKAYAKMYGNYLNIESGVSFQSMRELTGAPGKQFNLQENDIDINWKFIFDNKNKNYIQTAGSFEKKANQDQKDDKDDIRKANEMGIIYNHGYSILDVREVMFNNSVIKLLQLRNPWGKTEWNGQWSDKSDIWTEELKKELNYVNDDNGMFWISIQDFIKQFEIVNVCMVHDDYLYSSIYVNFNDDNKKGISISFTVSQQTHAFLAITQSDYRQFNIKKSEKKPYSFVKLIICKGSTDNIEKVIAEQHEAQRDVWLELNLEQGTYFAYLEIDWIQDLSQRVTISSYSQEQIIFNDDKLFKHVNAKLAQDIMITKSQQDLNQEKQYFDDNKEIYNQKVSIPGYLSNIYKNMSSATQINIDIKYITTNLEICNPNTDPNNIKITLNPGDQQIIVFKTNISKDGYTFKSNLSYSMKVKK